MAFDTEAVRRDLVGRIRSLGKPKGDFDLQSYLGSPYPVLGLTTPQIRQVHKEFRGMHPHFSVEELNALAEAMWAGPTFEEKNFAIGLLGRNVDLLDDRSWTLADGWVDTAIGWALSDNLASGPVSAMVRARSARFREVLRWTRSENFWRRRASTYALNDFIREGELDKPFQLLERLLYDDEFWVQRAVGTWLRECWKKDAKRTEAFLRGHVRGLPPVTITVATERASKPFRESLRRANRAARGRTR
ncbi:MAG TPA: DNA alkylation repair protein [Thermoplasmata archaeon]|nr:DNA alkylation repair protein [Thermoplasmata archaeon]